MDLLAHEINQFRGVAIDPAQLPIDVDEFRARLALSLATWQADALKLVWLDLPIAQARLIPAATEAGFVFHHSEEDRLTLLYRIQQDALVPTYATHFIGAGGVVINDRRELLVVNEVHRRDKSRPYWKLPGGALHPGEHLADAVVREVYEETGVRAKFEALVCFRHWHGYRWNKSDIYFICRLSPIDEAIAIQQDEIEDADWMPVEEYLASDYVGVFNKRIVQAALESPGTTPGWVDGYADPSRYEFFLPSHH